MSTSLRLALVLVIVTLGATLTLLVSGDATDVGTATTQLSERVHGWFTAGPATVQRESGPAGAKVTTDLDGTTAASPKQLPSFTAPVDDAARPAPTPAARTIEPPRAAAPGEFRAQPIAVEPTPNYVTAWPDFKTRSGGNIRLASASSAEIDSDARSGDSQIKELYVKNQDITTVLELLSREGHRNIVASKNVKGPLSITLYNTTVDDALSAILKMQGLVARQEGDYLRVYTPEDLQEAEAQSGKIEVRIYKPRYISATDLVEVLTPHLSMRGKISSTKPNQVGIASSGDNAGGDSLAVDDAVVVQDVESSLTRIEGIIERVDVRPPQVLI